MLVLSGAVLHDARKLVYPEEIDHLEDRHGLAGKLLLLQEGFPIALAEMSVAHAKWSKDSIIEQLLVATADHVWRGRRTADLQVVLSRKVAALLKIEAWKAFMNVDPILNDITLGAEARRAAVR